MTTPNKGFDELIANQSEPHVPVNSTFRKLDAIVQPVAIAIVTAPPSPVADGDVYLIGTGATGDYAGHDGQVAYYSGGLKFAVPQRGWMFYVEGDGHYVFNLSGASPAEWEAVTFTPASEGDNPETVVIQLACSDLTTDLATGTSVAYVRAPRAFTITDVRASLIDASSSGAVTVDINVGGSTILSTKITIDATEKTSVTAATPPVVSGPSVSDDSEITVDIDGAGTDAKGLIVTLIGSAV